MNIKMFGKKSIATMFYWFFLVLSILIFGLFLYNLILPLVLGDIETVYLNYKFSDGLDVTEFHRKLVVRLLFLSFYFFTISLIFKNVRAQNLFSKRVINLLFFFAIINFLPFLYSLINNIVIWGGSWFFVDALYGNLAYVSTGLLSLFMAAVFKQGYKLQQENDLTI